MKHIITLNYMPAVLAEDAYTSRVCHLSVGVVFGEFLFSLRLSNYLEFSPCITRHMKKKARVDSMILMHKLPNGTALSF